MNYLGGLKSARNLNYHFKALESQALSRAYFLRRPFRRPLENYCSCWVLSSIPALWYGTIGTVFNSAQSENWGDLIQGNHILKNRFIPVQI